MGNQHDQIGPISGSDQMLKGLVRELKNPLLFIARQAEFSSKTPDSKAAKSIEKSAQQALSLIDSYLLSAQAEYGQKQLDLQPLNIGSILYDVAQDMRVVAEIHNYELQVDTCYSRPVMADRRFAVTALSCLGQILLSPNNQQKRKVVKLSSFRRSSGQVVAGVLVQGSNGFSEADISRALGLQGNSQTSLKSGVSASGVHLALAESLANSMGSQVVPLKRFRMKGMGIEFIKSEQLALV